MNQESLSKEERHSLAETVMESGLFRFCVVRRVDVFELLRCESVEEYNNNNPLFPLEKEHFHLLKKKAEKVLKEETERKESKQYANH